MALSDFMRYFTGRAIALRPKQREVAADLPNRVRCDLTRAEDGSYFFEQRGQQDPLPEDFSGWAAYAVHDGVAHATTAHRTFRRMERTPEGGLLFPPEQLACRTPTGPKHRAARPLSRQRKALFGIETTT